MISGISKSIGKLKRKSSLPRTADAWSKNRKAKAEKHQRNRQRKSLPKSADGAERVLEQRRGKKSWLVELAQEKAKEERKATAERYGSIYRKVPH